MQQTILAISGNPGLYKLVSRGKNNLIVEALDATHRRQPALPGTGATPSGGTGMSSVSSNCSGVKAAFQPL